jgi:hypothetical protein
MLGNPVYLALHATATCCRSCLAKWQGIAAGGPLASAEIDHGPAAKGPVVVDWNQKDGEFRIALELPVGVTGQVGITIVELNKWIASVKVAAKDVKYEEGEGAVFVDGIGAGNMRW